jgi:hypothetical protein
MKRIMLLVTVALVMAVMLALGAGVAFADPGGLRGHTGSAGGCGMVSGGSGGPGGGGGLHDTVCSEEPPHTGTSSGGSGGPGGGEGGRCEGVATSTGIVTTKQVGSRECTL